MADAEFCLPMSRHGSNGKAFLAHTCMHRATDLLQLTGAELKNRCLPDPQEFPAGSAAPAELEERFGPNARLAFRAPSWARFDGRERFWIILSDRLAAPAAWAPDRRREPPLHVLGLVERLTWIQRLRRWIQGRS